MSDLTPIVFFVYNRPDHTRRTLEALAVNLLASESELFIYSDAAKNDEATESVQAVRSFIKTVRGFKSVTVIERDKNWGLANTIIDGVTEVVNKFGKVIVLEDDVETSPYFLKFMNEALNFYESEKRVWVITGHNYSINTDKLPNIVFSYFYSCWGWGIWADRWKHFDKNPDKYIALISKKDIYKFDCCGTLQYSQITQNKTGELNTWAVFLYAEMFVKKGLCLFPAKSLVRSIGLDGSGVHCKKADFLEGNYTLEKPSFDFSTIAIEENELYTKLCRKFFHKAKHKPFLYRAIRKCYRILKKLNRT